MLLSNQDAILKQIPLFSRLSAEQLKLIGGNCEFIEYKKNQIIYEEGAEADAFYCIVSGRVVLYTHSPQGKDTILEYLHKGNYFGIISLLTNDPHSVTAKAFNDSILLIIKKPKFDVILQEISSLAIDLSLTLSRRLKNKSLHQKTIFESTIVSAYSSYSQAGKTVYALNLALGLKKETNKSVIILEIMRQGSTPKLPRKLSIEADYKTFALADETLNYPGILREFVLKSNFGVDLACISYQTDDEPCSARLLELLSFLVNDYHYIILDLPSLADKFIFNILNQSDLVHILTGTDTIDLEKTRGLIEMLKNEFHFQDTKIKVVINEYKLSRVRLEEQRALLNGYIYATLPRMSLTVSDRLFLDQPNSEYTRALRRISRQTGDCLVGLALGIGVGYGFCHIGVLKVIEEQNIPIDVIAGSSIGSVIASFWAIGMSSDEILNIIKEEFRQPKYTWGLIDLTFPALGFIKGNKLRRFLKKYLGGKTFYDIRLPLKIIATDLRRKEPVVLDKGPLIDAVIASCSMPGVFRPFALRGGLLLDGGVTNPLPTDVLFNLGVKKIIAVNVTPSREDILKQYEQLKDGLTSEGSGIKKGKWRGLARYFQDKFKNNILDIIFSSVEVMQSEIMQKEMKLADIVLHPDTTGLHWLELYKVTEFAKRGEEEARKNLDKIKQLIYE